MLPPLSTDFVLGVLFALANFCTINKLRPGQVHLYRGGNGKSTRWFFLLLLLFESLLSGDEPVLEVYFRTGEETRVPPTSGRSTEYTRRLLTGGDGSDTGA